MQIGKRGRSTLVFLRVFTGNTVFYLDIPFDKTSQRKGVRRV